MIMFLFSLLFFMIIINKNPISLVMITMLQTMWIAMMTNLNKELFWYGYILILIYLGGMLILFSYICSLSSNEIFNKINTSILMLSLMMIMINMNHDFIITSNHNSFSCSLYSQNYMLMIMMLTYLMITMIIITKITMYKSGPLQQLM